MSALPFLIAIACYPGVYRPTEALYERIERDRRRCVAELSACVMKRTDKSDDLKLLHCEVELWGKETSDGKE